MDRERHVIVACQTYLSRDVRSALERLQQLHTVKKDAHLFEEALCVLNLLYTKLGDTADAVSAAEWQRASTQA